MLTIIIPTLDEAKIIGKTLTQLQRLRGDHEILICDGGSLDGTRKIAEELGFKVIKAQRGIPEQVTAGILEAKGDSFLILHADCLPQQKALDFLSEIGGSVAGGFSQEYDRFHPLSATQAFLNTTNARVFGRFSGEQGFFVTKEALQKAGGFPDSFVFETEDLCRKLRKAKIKPQVFPGFVVASNRRFQNNGLLAFLRMNWAHAQHGLVSPYRLKKHFGKVR